MTMRLFVFSLIFNALDIVPGWLTLRISQSEHRCLLTEACSVRM
jgi:hypothetical protein